MVVHPSHYAVWVCRSSFLSEKHDEPETFRILLALLTQRPHVLVLPTVQQPRQRNGYPTEPKSFRSRFGLLSQKQAMKDR